MERLDWLKAKRRQAEERMNTLFAPIYDELWGASIDPVHQSCIRKFLDHCPPGCVILDAACGTGKYWPLILSSGRSVLGMDQAQEMLNRAHAKSPDVPIRKQGLQELADLGDYEGIVCIDAMEYIPPEDWPVVLRNFHQALKPGGLLYLTVELPVEEEARAAFETAVNMGLPVVTGESAHEDGYHYYPSIAQVRDWIGRADFRVLEEVVGDDYHHFLIRR